jgi:hypothetical protein
LTSPQLTGDRAPPADVAGFIMDGLSPVCHQLAERTARSLP